VSDTVKAEHAHNLLEELRKLRAELADEWEATEALRHSIKIKTELQCQLQTELAAERGRAAEKDAAWREQAYEDHVKIAKLREALEPFAACEVWPGYEGDARVIGNIKISDLRRARTVLTETNGGEG
jgi:hypothetical protein